MRVGGGLVDVVVGGEGRTNWVKVWYEWEEEKRKMFSTERSQTVFGRKRFSPLNNKYFSKPPLKKKNISKHSNILFSIICNVHVILLVIRW